MRVERSATRGVGMTGYGRPGDPAKHWSPSADRLEQLRTRAPIGLTVDVLAPALHLTRPLRRMTESYLRYGGDCLALARCLLTDDNIAQEAVIAAFVRQWEDADRPPRVSRARPRLLMFTHHAAVDRLRELRSGSSGTVIRAEWGGCRAAAVQASPGCAPLLARLSRLPAEDREAFVLAYWGGYTRNEIAALTASSVSGVSASLRRAMLTLAVEVREPAAHGRDRGTHVRATTAWRRLGRMSRRFGAGWLARSGRRM